MHRIFPLFHAIFKFCGSTERLFSFFVINLGLLKYTFSTNRVKGTWVEIWVERPHVFCCDSLGLCFVKDQSLVPLPDLNRIFDVSSRRIFFKSY